MKTLVISAAEFKARCLQLMDEVCANRLRVVIQKRGRPVAELVPPEEQDSIELFGYLAGTVTEVGDITAPIESEWEADAT